MDTIEHLIEASLMDLKDYPIMLCKDDIRRMVPELSQGQLAALLQSPGFPTLKIGRRYYVSKVALLDWLIRQGRTGRTEVEIAGAHPAIRK